jgi:uncharacterized protein
MAMVHTFKMHGLKLALDVESGALHVLDDVAFRAVSDLAAGISPAAVQERLTRDYGHAASMVLDEIEKLIADGLLFSARRPLPPDREDGVVKALCLHLSHDCSLRCRYCFAGTGSYGGERGHMSPEVARQSVDFLLKESKGRRHCEIDFFGGEPLLNFPVLQETVAYGRERARQLGKILKFTVTTNALALDRETRAYLNSENISVVLSLDGRREVHDRLRRRPDGRPSYGEVLANCRALAQERGQDNYYLRGTYTRHNLDFCADVQVMLAEGFENISLEPVVLAPGPTEALREEDLPLLFTEYEQLAKLLWQREQAGHRVRFFHFELDLDKGPCAKKRVSGCGAGTAYLAVAADGRLYPCHQFVGTDFCAGHVAGEVDGEALLPFREALRTEKEACQGCFSYYFCGGGCLASAWLVNKDLCVPYNLGCQLHRCRVECGLYLQAARFMEEAAK